MDGTRVGAGAAPRGWRVAELRLLNELGLEAAWVELTPSRRCKAHCTYCFAELNRRVQRPGHSRRYEDPGTFESAVERAFGPGYDPTDVLQYTLRERYPVVWSNTVEPFQDVPMAASIARILADLGIPAFLQTKGLNAAEIWPHLLPLAGNATFYVSFPTDDDRVLKRFEPGTPPAAERYALIERAADAGFHVVLAMAPYHDRWCKDPAAHVRRAAALGARHVFYDRLHLNDRQRRAIRERGGDAALLSLAGGGGGQGGDEAAVEHLGAIYDAAAELGLRFTCNGFRYLEIGAMAPDPTMLPPEAVSRGRTWPYLDVALLGALEAFEDDVFDAEEGRIDPVSVTFSEAVGLLESGGEPVEQPFSLRSMSALMLVDNLAPAWRRTLEPEAPMRAYLRALWNSPNGGRQLAWRHPYARVAKRPDGLPHRDAAGDIVMLFGRLQPRGLEHEVEDLAELTAFSAAAPDEEEAAT